MSKKIIIVIAVALALAVAITASVIIFQSNAEYEVVFHSDTGEVLAVETVKRNKTATPPEAPYMSYGNVFKKWDTDFTKVKEDLSISPETESFIDKANTFALSGAYGEKDDTVFVPFVLAGDVCLSGFDLSVNYDKAVLELESVFNEDGAIIYNAETEGVVRINYTSLENTVGDVDICSFKFKIKEEVEKTDLSITMNSICANKGDEELYTPESNLINSSVYILPSKGGD